MILVTRGGGSLEDLWAFNEEVVARAIFDSTVPVVSAVGHEIDFTIADFVADLRAATPSAGAELFTEGMYASREFVTRAAGRLRQRAAQRLARAREDEAQWSARLHLAHPRHRLNESLQRLDDLQTALARGASSRWRACQAGWHTHFQRLLRVKPAQWLARRQQAVRELERRLLEQTRRQFQTVHHRQTQAAARLRLLAPDNVLARGYSITTDAATGAVLRSAAEVKAGQRLNTRLKSGAVRSVAEE